MLRLTLALLALAAPAVAQDRIPSHCVALAQAPGVEYLQRASYGTALPDANTVRLNYVDHSMWMLETAGGLRAVTDYNGFIGSVPLPDIVTMNRGHITHWTPNPDPAIPHVLPGWSDRVGEPVDHYLDLGEMLIRSVSTDIRPGVGGEQNGNSIFVFEAGGLCIGHLGHLHHEPTREQYIALGRLDVVMAPVDGGLTLPHETLARVLGRLRSSVVLPMHWFGEGSLQPFLEAMEDYDFEVDRRAASFIEVSLTTLPRRPTIVVLRPQFLSGSE